MNTSYKKMLKDGMKGEEVVTIEYIEECIEVLDLLSSKYNINLGIYGEFLGSKETNISTRFVLYSLDSGRKIESDNARDLYNKISMIYNTLLISGVKTK